MRVKGVRLAILAVLATSTAGCATSTVPTTPTVTFIDVPPVGELSEASIGSTLVQKAKIYVVDGLRLDSRLTIGSGGMRFELDPGEYAATARTRLHTLYFAVNPGMTRDFTFNSITDISGAGFRIRDSDGYLDAFLILDPSNVLLPYSLKEPVTVVQIKVSAINEPSFRQELIYNGRIGDTIRVLYREFQNDMARPAFTQDVVYDLAESNVIGFRDVRIEIEDANNTRVRYRVISGFPDIE